MWRAVVNSSFRSEKRCLKNRRRKRPVRGDAFLGDRVFTRRAPFSRSAGSALVSPPSCRGQRPLGLRGIVRDSKAPKTCCHDGFSFLFESACFSDIGRNWEFP